MKGASLQIVRRYRAAPETVFAVCTDPKTMATWLGPDGWTALEVRADVRVGGSFWFRMEGPQGIMAAEGDYEVVEPPHRLVHSWRWTETGDADPPTGITSRITYDIRADGDATVLTFTQEGLDDQNSADSHKEGWSESLEKLAAVLGEDTGQRQ